MHFPVEDVVKNVRYFMSSVKRVTGNSKEAEEGRKSKNSGAKPGESTLHSKGGLLHANNCAVTVISKVMLSSRQGPGVRISDY
jgi:large subunit ribosomal protein L1